MRSRFLAVLVLIGLGLGVMSGVHAALPASKVGDAVAQGIQQTLVRRGFAANDPRIQRTISAVSSRTLATARAAGVGTSWLGLMGRLNPWMTAGFLVYEGYRWYAGPDGTVGTEAVVAPAQIGGIVEGGGYWVSTGVSGSDPYSVAFQSIMPTNPNSKWTVWSFEYSDSGVLWGYERRFYRYSMHHPIHCPSGGCLEQLAIAEYHPSGALATCPAGFYLSSSGACDPYTFRLTGGNAAQTTPSQTYQQAYDALPQAAKDAALDPEVVAELANRVWRDAAAQPDYSGEPWSSSSPATQEDFQPYTHSNEWPRVRDLATAVPGNGQASSPGTDSNRSISSETVPRLDLGPDPGVSAPDLEEPPSNLFQPIQDLLQPWLAWQVPNHSAMCPVWQAAPSIAGHTFHIDLSYHCELAEQYRALIQAAAMACWMVIAAFIILSA